MNDKQFHQKIKKVIQGQLGSVWSRASKSVLGLYFNFFNFKGFKELFFVLYDNSGTQPIGASAERVGEGAVKEGGGGLKDVDHTQHKG